MEKLELKYKKDNSLIWGMKKPVFSEINSADELTGFINTDYIRQRYQLSQSSYNKKTNEVEFTNKWDLDALAELVHDALSVISIYNTKNTALLYYDFKKYDYQGEAKVGLFIECISKFYPTMMPINNNIASEIINKCKRNYQIEFEKLNDYPNLLNTIDGIINKDVLPKIEIIPHSSEYLFTYCIPRRLKEDKDIEEKIYKFLSDLVNKEDIINLYELAAFIFIPSSIHKKLIMTLGESDAGKTGYTTFLSNLFESQYIDNNFSIHGVTSDPFALAETEGKILLIDDDISSSEIENTRNLKIISGSKSDYITARKIHIGKIKFPLMFKVFCNANKLPKIKKENQENALWGRWWIINFPYVFVDNPNPELSFQKKKMSNKEIKEFISDPDILDVFFTKILEFYQDVFEHGITITNNSLDIKELWLENSDLSYRFKNLMLKEDINYCIIKEDYFEQHKLFCDEIGEPPLTKQALTKKLMEHGKFAKDYKPKINGKRTYCLLGYKWKKRINKELEILDAKDVLDFKNIKIKKELML